RPALRAAGAPDAVAVVRAQRGRSGTARAAPVAVAPGGRGEAGVLSPRRRRAAFATNVQHAWTLGATPRGDAGARVFAARLFARPPDRRRSGAVEARRAAAGLGPGVRPPATAPSSR